MVSYIREEGYGRERSLLWITAVGLAVFMIYGSVDYLVPEYAEQSIARAFSVAHDKEETLYSVYPDPLWRWTLQRLANLGAIEEEMSKTTTLCGLGMLVIGCLSLRTHFRREQNLYSDFSVVWFVCALFLTPIYGTSAPLSILMISLLAPMAASMRSPSIIGGLGVGVFSSFLLLSNQGLIWFVVALNVALLIQQIKKNGPHKIFACIWGMQLFLVVGYYVMVFMNENRPDAVYFQLWSQNASWFNISMPNSVHDWALIASCLMAIGVIALRTPMAWLGWGVLLHSISLIVWSAPSDDVFTSSTPIAALSVLAPDWIHNQKVFPHQIRIVILLAIALMILSVSVYTITQGG